MRIEGMMVGIGDSQKIQPANGKKLDVAIIGGGLVGSLSACFFAKKGHNVSLYEYRGDIRKMKVVQGRSINLAMSVRARTALQEVGLESQVIQEHGIPLKARMIHRFDGSKYPIPYDAVTNQCIYSISRKFLNETLLTAAESYPTVRTVFEQKLTSVNLLDGVMTFSREGVNEEVTEKADLIVGADGAYSTVRKEMLRFPSFDYSQKYIPHGYVELCIPPTKDGKFAMELNYLHIWPRGSFMLIALPNQDVTWTCTLFMPFENFESLKTPEKLLNFFGTHFPDAVPLIGEARLIEDFFATKPSPLISVKCNPYHVGSKSIIIGDAAHAMVPFFGQGMNAGFEDCLLLDKLMDTYNCDLMRVLPAFSERRNPDAEAICDLAMYNYIEMRDLVNKRSFLLRKKLDNILYGMLREKWVPLYNSVTFTTMNYKACIRNREFQDKIITGSIIILGIIIFIIAFYFY